MSFKILRCDIADLEAEVFVNSTDAALSGSGGADMAIQNAAGEGLEKYKEGLEPLSVGKPFVTPAFGLSAKHIIHIVAPDWRYGSGEEELRAAYLAVLDRARELGAKSLVTPLLSAGRFSCPKKLALTVASTAIRDFLEENEMEVTLAVYDGEVYRLSLELLEDVVSYLDENYEGEQKRDLSRLLPREGRSLPHSYGDPYEACSEIDACLSAPSDGEEGEGLHGSVGRRYPTDHSVDIYRMITKKRRDGASPSRSVGGRMREDARLPSASPPPPLKAGYKPSSLSLEDMLKNLDDAFPVALGKLIDAKGLDDVECYKKANISKQTWYKIQSQKGYRPSKQTVICFAISLRLTLPETEALLLTAGLALSKSQVFDVIVRYFIENGRYDPDLLNNTLFSFDQPLLFGSSD